MRQQKKSCFCFEFPKSVEFIFPCFSKQYLLISSNNRFTNTDFQLNKQKNVFFFNIRLVSCGTTRFESKLKTNKYCDRNISSLVTLILSFYLKKLHSLLPIHSIWQKKIKENSIILCACASYLHFCFLFVISNAFQ